MTGQLGSAYPLKFVVARPPLSGTGASSILVQMDALRPLRWKVSLVASVALLLHSLMPVLMPARAASGGSPADWVEVCSGGKVQLVAARALNGSAATTNPGKSDIAKATLDDCSSCSHHGTTAVPNASGREPPALLVHQLSLELASDVLDPQFAWAIAHTRSPPTLS
jgi:hypothetical protein